MSTKRKFGWKKFFVCSETRGGEARFKKVFLWWCSQCSGGGYGVGGWLMAWVRAACGCVRVVHFCKSTSIIINKMLVFVIIVAWNAKRRQKSAGGKSYFLLDSWDISKFKIAVENLKSWNTDQKPSQGKGRQAVNKKVNTSEVMRLCRDQPLLRLIGSPDSGHDVGSTLYIALSSQLQLN